MIDAGGISHVSLGARHMWGIVLVESVVHFG